MIRLGIIAAVIVGHLVLASEADLRAAFMKEYQTPNASQRAGALEKLKNSKERESWMFLYNASTVDKEADVRLIALRMLAETSDPDGYVAHLCGQSFRSEPGRAMRIRKAQLLGKLEFKASALSELCEALYPMRYVMGYREDDDPVVPGRGYNRDGRPNLPAGIGSVHSHGESEYSRQEREYVETLVKAIEELSGESVPLEREIGKKMKGWWGAKAPAFVRFDRGLADKKRGETRNVLIQPIAAAAEPAAQAEQDKPSKKDDGS